MLRKGDLDDILILDFNYNAVHFLLSFAWHGACWTLH